MDLSIVIVNWNTSEILADCLESLNVDTLADLKVEIIVVDNGSSDGSAEMVETRFREVTLIRNRANRGFAAANNQGIEVAQGTYVLLLNSDTVVLDSVLPDSVKYMEEHQRVGCMGCRVLNADGTMQPTCFRFPSLVYLMLYASGLLRVPWPRCLGYHLMRDWNRDSERDVEVVTGCFLLIRRATLAEVGVLDESFFFYGEETDLQVRVREAGWKVRFAPVGEIVHLGGASTERISETRQRLLDDALIRLNRKHVGVFAGVCARMTLAMRRLRCAFLAPFQRSEAVSANGS